VFLSSRNARTISTPRIQSQSKGVKFPNFLIWFIFSLPKILGILSHSLDVRPFPLENETTISTSRLRTHTIGIALFAVRRWRTAPPLPCAFSQTARQRAPGSFLPGKELCRAFWEKATHGTVGCRA
jgi:hypothetical protein